MKEDSFITGLIDNMDQRKIIEPFKNTGEYLTFLKSVGLDIMESKKAGDKAIFPNNFRAVSFHYEDKPEDKNVALTTIDNDDAEPFFRYRLKFRLSEGERLENLEGTKNHKSLRLVNFSDWRGVSGINYHLLFRRLSREPLGRLLLSDSASDFRYFPESGLFLPSSEGERLSKSYKK